VIGSPHIGASTAEGQARVGAEVADILIEFYEQNR
jgi:phosphoglycerate dehydrogenase-like enzyme